MHDDIKDRLHDTIPNRVPALDHERLQRHGRRRRHVKRAGAAGAAAAVVFAAVVSIPWPGGDVTIDDRYAHPGTPDPTDQQGEAVHGWEGLPVNEAIDRLILANRAAPAPPALTGDQQLVMHGLGAGFRGATDGSAHLVVAQSEVRLNPDGSGREHHSVLVERIPVGTPADEIRTIARQTREANTDPIESIEEEAYVGPTLDVIGEMVREDTTTPPGQDDRPSQPAAYLELRDAMLMMHQPADRIRALELIRSMDARWIDYESTARDLLGRAGVGIVGIDPVDDSRHTIVFDPDTGDVLGTIEERAWKGGERVITGMSAITHRRIVEP